MFGFTIFRLGVNSIAKNCGEWRILVSLMKRFFFRKASILVFTFKGNGRVGVKNIGKPFSSQNTTVLRKYRPIRRRYVLLS